MTKKLANTKGFPLAMMIIAFLISAAAAAQEFISFFIYDKTFSGENKLKYVLLKESMEYFEIYGFSAMLFVFSFLALLVFFAGAGKKTTGYKEGVLLMSASVAAAVAPTANFLIYADTGRLDADNYGQGDLFRNWNTAVTYLAPAVVCLFLFLAGLGLVIKVKASKTVAVIPAEPKPAPQPVQAQPVPVQPAPQPIQEQPVVSEPAQQAVAASAPVMEEAAVPALEEASEAVIEEVKPVGNVCKNCGEALPEGAKFCRSCGAKQGE